MEKTQSFGVNPKLTVRQSNRNNSYGLSLLGHLPMANRSCIQHHTAFREEEEQFNCNFRCNGLQQFYKKRGVIQKLKSRSRELRRTGRMLRHSLLLLVSFIHNIRLHLVMCMCLAGGFVSQRSCAYELDVQTLSGSPIAIHDVISASRAAGGAPIASHSFRLDSGLSNVPRMNSSSCYSVSKGGAVSSTVEVASSAKKVMNFSVTTGGALWYLTNKKKKKKNPKKRVKPIDAAKVEQLEDQLNGVMDFLACASSPPVASQRQAEKRELKLHQLKVRGKVLSYKTLAEKSIAGDNVDHDVQFPSHNPEDIMVNFGDLESAQSQNHQINIKKKKEYEDWFELAVSRAEGNNRGYLDYITSLDHKKASDPFISTNDSSNLSPPKDRLDVTEELSAIETGHEKSFLKINEEVKSNKVEFRKRVASDVLKESDERLHLLSTKVKQLNSMRNRSDSSKSAKKESDFRQRLMAARYIYEANAIKFQLRKESNFRQSLMAKRFELERKPLLKNIRSTEINSAEDELEGLYFNKEPATHFDNTITSHDVVRNSSRRKSKSRHDLYEEILRNERISMDQVAKWNKWHTEKVQEFKSAMSEMKAPPPPS